MNNATFLHDEIMAGGAGRIDVYAAATSPIRIDPPSISLGLAPIEVSNWSATRSLHVTNSGTQPVTYNVKSSLVIGEKVTPSSATVTIPAGGATDISFDFAIDNSVTLASPASFTGGGQIVLTNAAVPADVHNIQFAFTKAARATVTFDRAYPDALWVNESRSNIAAGAHLDDNTSEVLMIPGTWDMLIYTREFDENGVITGVDFIGREAVPLTKDTAIALTAADIPHTITLGGRRETGEPLTGSGYASGGRILLGSGGSFTALTFPFTAVHQMRVSNLTAAKSLLLYETMLDPFTNSYYMIQHPPLVGVNADANLTTGGSALRGGIVQLAVPPASRGDRRLGVSATSLTGAGVSLTSIVDASVVNAHVFVSPDVHPNYTYGIAFTAVSDAATQYATPLLHVVNDKLVSLTVAGLLPWTYSGSMYQFGLGPRFPTTTLTRASSRVSWQTDIIGPLGELRVADRSGTINTLFDANGAVVNFGGFSTSIDLATTPAAYRLQSINNGTLYPGVNKTTTVSMNLDSSRADYIPPSLTTMMLLDGSGTLVTRLQPHGSGSLLVSAADFAISGTTRVYQQIAAHEDLLSLRRGDRMAFVDRDAGDGSSRGQRGRNSVPRRSRHRRERRRRPGRPEVRPRGSVRQHDHGDDGAGVLSRSGTAAENSRGAVAHRVIKPATSCSVLQLRVTIDAISSEGETRSGTMITAIPAARAARTPASESSRTRQCAGSMPRRCAARRKRSGAGFDCDTSSPNASALKREARSPRQRSARTRGDDVASAFGMLRFSSASSNSIAPGLRAIVETRSWKSRAQRA
jgi:hypothetical protein